MKLIRIILAALSLPILFVYLLPLIGFLEIKKVFWPSVEQACKNEELGFAIKAKYQKFIDWKF